VTEKTLRTFDLVHCRSSAASEEGSASYTRSEVESRACRLAPAADVASDFRNVGARMYMLVRLWRSVHDASMRVLAISRRTRGLLCELLEDHWESDKAIIMS